MHKAYNRLDIYTEPPPIQYNKRYQDNDISMLITWPGCINVWRYVASWNLIMYWSLVARLLFYLLIFTSLHWLMPVELLK
jgi:hypothetical protein